jgi:hypothetical protein
MQDSPDESRPRIFARDGAEPMCDVRLCSLGKLELASEMDHRSGAVVAA